MIFDVGLTQKKSFQKKYAHGHRETSAQAHDARYRAATDGGPQAMINVAFGALLKPCESPNRPSDKIMTANGLLVLKVRNRINATTPSSMQAMHTRRGVNFAERLLVYGPINCLKEGSIMIIPVM